MKKLCYICHGLGPNGIDMLIVNILSAIDREKYDVTLIIAIDEGAEQFNEQKVRDMGIPIFRTNDMGSNRRILSHFKRLKKLLKEIRPDIVHSHMGFLDGINCLAAKMAGVPMRVCHAHNSASTKDAGKSKYSVSKIYHDIYHYTMKGLCKAFSNRFCGCSEEAIGYYYGGRYLKKHKAVVINNAIDLSKFESVDRDTCMRKYGYDNSIRRIVTVGRLTEQKNPFFIIDTMRELCAIRNDVELLWIGDGHLKDQIEEKCAGGGILSDYLAFEKI